MCLIVLILVIYSLDSKIVHKPGLCMCGLSAGEMLHGIFWISSVDLFTSHNVPFYNCSDKKFKFF